MKKTNKIILIIAIILIIVVLGVVVYFGIKNKQDSDKKIEVLENQIAELKNNNENNNKTANNDMNNENQISNSINKKQSENVQSDNYDNANKEIKKALMDENWLKGNDLDKELKDGSTTWKTSRYIVKINDIGNMPAYLIKCNIMDSSYTKLVTYKNGKVYISKTSAGSDYCDEFLDKENNIVKSVNQSVDLTTIYKIENYEFKKLEEYNTEKESFEKFKKDNFEEISIEMTNENIDKIVK